MLRAPIGRTGGSENLSSSAYIRSSTHGFHRVLAGTAHWVLREPDLV